MKSRTNGKSWMPVLGCGLLVAAVLAAMPRTASAGVYFHYEADQSVFTLDPNGSVVVTLKLVEVRDSADDVSVLTSEKGLFGYDVKVMRNGGLAQVTGMSANTDLFPLVFNVVFNPSINVIGEPYEYDDTLSKAIIIPDGSDFAEFTIISMSKNGPTGSANGLRREVTLGTVTITAPGAYGTSSTFSIMDSDLGTNTLTNTVVFDGTNYVPKTILDSILAPATITVNTSSLNVPEPASLGLMGLGVMGLLRRRR